MVVRFLAFSSGGRTLRLTHTSVSDEGQYTCVVTNAAGEVRKDFNLSILGKCVIIFITVEDKGVYCILCWYFKNYYAKTYVLRGGKSEFDNMVRKSGFKENLLLHLNLLFI